MATNSSNLAFYSQQSTLVKRKQSTIIEVRRYKWKWCDLLDLTCEPSEFFSPFRHMRVNHMLGRTATSALLRGFPRKLSTTVRKSGTDKTYQVSNRRLLEANGRRNSLSPAWNRLLDDIEAKEYREFLSIATNMDLSGAIIEVDINAYATSGFMSPHTDRDTKILTHIFYLQEYWPPQWGGELALLREASGPTVETIAPQWPVSVILPRSNNSWHSVLPVSPDARRRRLTVQISFWSERPPPPRSGRTIL